MFCSTCNQIGHIWYGKEGWSLIYFVILVVDKVEGTVCRRCTYVAGARPYGLGHMAGAQYTTVSGQVNLAHAPPTVRTGAWEEGRIPSQARINCAANFVLFCLFHAPV